MKPSVRERRRSLGLTQAELALAAGVSRPLISALEAGRHVPSVSSAISLARVLRVSVEALFGAEPGPMVPVLSENFEQEVPVWVGTVGECLVYAPLPDHGATSQMLHAGDGWFSQGQVRLFPGSRSSGVVVVGCEPALGLMAELLPAQGPERLIPVHASSHRAREVLRAGRAHAILVHGRPHELAAPEDLHRFELAAWRVGLASMKSRPSSLQAVASGQGVLAQREPGAAVQAALERALARAGTDLRPRGPIAAGHLDAARRVVSGSVSAALTIEPAALLFGLHFNALEEHRVELWVPERFVDHAGVAALMQMLVGSRFRTRLGQFGGYAVAGTGREIRS